ncbi:MFS transporter [Corallococcus sp. AB004]|uniref:POT family MFS transporter n=1 Tax=Corallococcus TaxID=83461 RepID=UPI000EA009AB|nr:MULTISPECIES: POT family MFS transporter [Corallococcus]RKI36168.1 MFS transporter [Corallococcus sp. AB004]NPC71125.1 POT family MFS transporter [Corallococcus exiguus]NPD26795.1 POT family MFS transporter [Corallococcus exiguus]NRD49242.1 POT family MFS transporter [Corallococcus exiguus]RKH96086.1 MFS transporter [Corallococcus sp. AB038B]
MAETSTAPTSQRFPPQIPYIIGNEACERFSFYGMRNILVVFFIDYLLRTHVPETGAREAQAKYLMHLFMAGVYFFPLLGGYLADRFFGKFHTIFVLSLVYCAGHACLALFEDNATGFYTGLTLIAIGSGGIKPCVSAMVGDQFTETNKHLVKKVFAIFYWTINFGSFFASLFVPVLMKNYGPAVAFGVPGILMFLATIIFWAGRKHYVLVPPTGPNPHSFFKVLGSAFRGKDVAGGTWLDKAKAEHPAESVEGVKAVFRVSALMLPFVPFFWMLFDQKASTWVVQARSMDPNVGGIVFQPSQMQFINPMLVMLLIPFLTAVVYPAFQRMGWELTPLRRMPLGLVIGAASFVIAGFFQVAMEGGTTLNIAWQLLPYIVLTVAEILVSTTGLEFAYTQAPRQMKGTIQSVWLVTNTLANVAVAIAAALNVFTGSAQFFFYAALATVAAVGMALVARRYVVRDYYQTDAQAPMDGRNPGVEPKPA